MPLASGTTFGSYEIRSLLGMGGMGEVYRATDGRLARDVALKFLPQEFAADSDRLARFRREAQLLASLNHAHIATIHGLEEAGGNPALVMELVEGPALSDRIAQGPIPIDETLAIAKQIAEALEYAHERGVIHRDLKPANIKFTSNGQVKVLDFGLAKALSNEMSSSNQSNSPTISLAATQAGMIMGTAGYMSPEQAKGKSTDRRADIWAFGVVLYEMLTGRTMFSGETASETMAQVMMKEPDWALLPASTPRRIQDLLRRCLVKDPRNRLQAIGDARIEIEAALNPALAEPVGAASAPNRRRERQWMSATLVATLIAVVLGFLYLRPATTTLPKTRLEITTPPAGQAISNFAISPDGRKVVFLASTEGKTQLWIRPLESETAQPLAGTENATFPFWSPDSRSVAFTADAKLKRIDTTGGGAQTIADVPGLGGGAVGAGTWNSAGIILFTPSTTGPIYAVPAAGGQSVEVTRLEKPDHASHRHPYFLPDGHHFLFFVAGTQTVQGVYIGSLDSKEIRRLMLGVSSAIFAPPDFVLFRRDSALLAQHLDMKTLELKGNPYPLAERVSAITQAVGEAAFSASRDGVIAYRPPLTNDRQLTWFDRSGRQTATLGQPDAFSGGNGPHISPDGRTVALSRTINGNPDVWLIDTARGIVRRFTSDPASDNGPVWSPDGAKIVFYSRRSGPQNLWLKPLDGGSEERLLESSENNNPTDWSPDGRFILYDRESDVWALPVQGDRKPFAVVHSNFDETNGRLSPDSHWVVYESNESGRTEVYVQRFPGPGGVSQISTNGGTNPQWRMDGREILYRAADDRLMAVPITPQADGQRLEPATPEPLFSIPPGAPYDITRDGQRILIGAPVGDATTPPITLILNWRPPAN
jgi:eukaryotic-like serine/threonine-protein kinase